MKDKTIWTLIGLSVVSLTAVMVLTCCTHAPDPGPIEDTCAAMCANLDRLGCGSDNCQEVCQRHEHDDPDLVDEACVTAAGSCAAVEACSE